MPFVIKFINSEKSQKFCTTVYTVKGKGKILQTFVAFSEYMNFNIGWPQQPPTERVSNISEKLYFL